jgi:hypothetical protein
MVHSTFVIPAKAGIQFVDHAAGAKCQLLRNVEQPGFQLSLE